MTDSGADSVSKPLSTICPVASARRAGNVIFGCIAGIIPWLIIVTQLLSPNGPAGSSAPGFVYGIVISLFVFFNCFALVQYKQYRAKGKWSNYLRGEKTYIILSFSAKSLLAWQIFAATLVK